MGPGWAVLAGALASGAPLLSGAEVLRLVGAVLLADPVWGMIAPVARQRVDLVSPPVAPGILPYAQAQAPLARLVSRLHQEVGARHWSELTTGLAFAIGLSLLLGVPAMALSGLAFVVTSVARLWTQSRGHPALLHALWSLGLPWLLGMTTALGRAEAVRPLSMAGSLLFAAAFMALQAGVVHHAGAGRLAAGQGTLWLGQLSVLAASVAAQQPWITALSAVLFLPPSLWLLQRGTIVVTQTSDEGVAFGRVLLVRCAPWWLAAMMTAAVIQRILLRN